MKGFVEFLRKQGVVGLAVGFILGGALQKVVSGFVTDIINPLLGLILGHAEGLKTASVHIGSAAVAWGDFVSILIDFTVVAAVVYFGVLSLKLDKLDLPKESK